MCPIKYLVKPGFQKLTMSSEQQQKQQQQNATFCEMFFFFSFLNLIHYFPTIQDTKFEIFPAILKPDLVIGARVSI